VSTNKVAIGSPRELKRYFRAMQRLLKGSGVQLVFSILPIAGNDIERNRQLINTRL